MFLLIQTQTGGTAGTPNDSNLPATLQVSSVFVAPVGSWSCDNCP
jgi:hypothetical protein